MIYMAIDTHTCSTLLVPGSEKQREMRVRVIVMIVMNENKIYVRKSEGGKFMTSITQQLTILRQRKSISHDLHYYQPEQTVTLRYIIPTSKYEKNEKKMCYQIFGICLVTDIHCGVGKSLYRLKCSILLFEVNNVLYNILVYNSNIHQPPSNLNLLGKGVFVVVWQQDLQLFMQSIRITTNVVNLNLAHGEMHTTQQYVIQFASGKSVVFFVYTGVLPPIKLTATI